MNPNLKNRVVVTGLGVISSIGIGWQEFWKNLILGKSGISRITAFETKDIDRHYGGEVRNVQLDQFMRKSLLKKYGKTSQLTLVATKLALDDSNLGNIRNKNISVCIGTTMGEPQLLEAINRTYMFRGLEAVDKRLIPFYGANSLSCSIAKEFKLRGNTSLFANACSAGNHSIAYSMDLVKHGVVDIAIAGGADSFAAINVIGFNRLLAMAPEKCQPFDKNRQGMLVGEGAGILVIESLAHAIKRKAEIYAELVDYSISCDGVSMTDPDFSGVVNCLEGIFTRTGLEKYKVDYISAHGTGTKRNDYVEAQAINQVFGKITPQVPVSSIKSMLGHTMGAASAIEAIACCLVVRNNIMPPTINFETPDQDCLVDCVPNRAREKRINLLLNNAYAFGGNNTSLAIRKFD